MTRPSQPAPDAGSPVLAAARIDYRGDQPYSLDFQDIYHAGDGAAEVQRVFIGPGRVAETAAEKARRSHPAAATIRVGELGFGSGLNFVVAAQVCLDAGARLHFFSFEAHPIDAADFAAIAARRAAGHPLYRELAAAYPPRLDGWHQCTLAGGRVCLWLWFGAADHGLADLTGRQRQPMDTWFLDGFAPNRNPALWQPALMQAMAGLSRSGTRVATFTAAGRVRRALEAAGFAMARVDQRPHKRESLAGSFARPGLAGFDPPRRVLVVGGGLAGASAAWQLARAGCQVRLADAPGTGALPPGSSMPVSVLHARLLADGSAAGELRCRAYLHAARAVRGMPGFRASGALQLAGAQQTAARLQAVQARYGASGNWLDWLDAEAAADLAHWPVGAGGLYLPDAGVVDMPALIAALTADPAIEVVNEPVTDLPADRPAVLAAGAGVRRFAAAGYLEVAAVYGQLDRVAAPAMPALPVVGHGYLVPGDGLLTAGSTYEYRPWDPEEATRANLAQLQGLSCTWHSRCRGTRAVSSDRTAIAGPLYAVDGRADEHVLVSAGHGSAGNVTAHLAGAVIAAHLMGDCPPLARRLAAALSPWRFRERQARRGVRQGAPDQ